MLGGDDLLVVGTGQSVMSSAAPTQCEDGNSFTFCSAIKPGIDGVLSSVAGGDERGDWWTRSALGDERSANADSDQDLVADGFERTLGSSPNRPGDAAFGGDMDEDGLTDSMERAGWTYEVRIGTAPATVRPLETSNPLLVDSDFDGLPDYAERYMPCPSQAR